MNTVDEPNAAPQHPGLIGTKVDRFVLLERLGAGGMGEVFLARDPQLNRRVALKLLKRKPTDDDRAMGQLLQEARAMAQVSHPNVVSVFDAGMHGEQPWVAMEWIRGRTLREWLATPRPWPETLKLLCDVGRGLQAAHDAGLVHRDLKPENVLVGDTGRAAVTDFGLAHGSWPSSHASPGHEGLMGTPGYLAPEQLRRGGIDARTDQFAFSITAYEALYGVKPFATEADVEQPPQAPPPSKVPPRVWRTLARGLSLTPAQRHPSMAAMVAELEGAMPRASRTLGLTVAGLAVAAAAGVTYAATRPRACDQGPKLLAPTWSESRRATLAAALQSTPVGSAVAPKLLEALDAWAGGWVAMERESCEATRAGSQSATLLDLRSACLRRRLAELDAMVALLSGGGASVAEKADGALAALTPVAACADVVALGERAPVPAGRAPQVEALDQALARVKAMADLGQFREAVAPANEVVERARALGYAPLLAEALVVLGGIELSVDEREQGARTLDEAMNAAELARDDRSRARARLMRARLLLQQRKLDDAQRELTATTAVIERAGAPALSREARALAAELATTQGKLDEALQLAQQAVEAAERQSPVDQRELVSALAAHALTLIRLAKFAESAVVYERLLPLAEQALGSKNPGFAVELGVYVAVLGKLRRLDDARPYHARAEAIIAASLGPDSSAMAEDLYNWGITLLLNRDLEGAQVALERSLELKRKHNPPDHPTIAGSLNSLAVLAVENGKFDEAAARFKEAVAIREKALGPVHPLVLADFSDLAGAYSMGGRHAEALAVFDDILERQKRASGRPSDATQATFLLGRGEELLELHRFSEARQSLGLAHPLAVASEDPAILARQALLEARVAWDGDGNEAKAKKLFAEATPSLNEAGDPELKGAFDELLARIAARKRER